MAKKKKAKRLKRNHGLVAYGVGIGAAHDLGYGAALQELEMGDWNGAIERVNMHMNDNVMLGRTVKRGIGLQIVRNNVGPVKLFSTKKAVVSLFGR